MRPAPTATWYVRYCEGWDPASRALIGPITEATAQARAADGNQYTVALTDHDHTRPRVIIDLSRRDRYACAWHFDEHARRTRKLEYRQLADGRLFLLTDTEWTYTTTDQPEFDDQAGHHERRTNPDGHGLDETSPSGYGGDRTRTEMRFDPDELTLSYPDFGDWTTLAGAHHVLQPPPTLRPAQWAAHALDAAPVLPPWHPVRPAQPRRLDVLFRPGARLALPADAEVTIDVVPAGELVLPTGYLAVHDPGWLEFTDDLLPFTAAVAPGRYPVHLAVLRWPGRDGMGRTVGARVLIRDGPVVSWEPALCGEQDPVLLRADELVGFGVDAGMGCFFDFSLRETFARVVQDQYDTLAATPMDAAHLVTDPESGGTLIAFTSGYGDGCYPTWLGRTHTGEVGCFVADMLVLDDATVLD